MLLEYGNTHVDSAWHVSEKTPPGFCRVYYVYRGKVTYTDRDCSRLLTPGKLYLFPNAVAYEMVQDPAERLVCTFLHLDIYPEILTDLVELEPEKDVFLKRLFYTFALAIAKEPKATVFTLADAIADCFRQKNIFTPIDASFTRVLQAMIAVPGEPLSISELSKIGGYHPQYFIRKFRREFGITPYQYLLNLRLKNAVFLLGQDMTISEIASKTGFADTKALDKAFKKKYGVAPTLYYRYYRAQP